MELFPYDTRQLRCHTMFAYIVNPCELHGKMTVHSRTKIQVRCAGTECANVFERRICDLYRQTNQCPSHHGVNRGGVHSTYEGPIPQSVTSCIRAGLLRRVDRGRLTEEVATIEPVKSEADPMATARRMIEEIRAAYSDTQLANNCFWGFNSSVRKHKPLYKHPPKKPRRADVAGVVEGTQTTSVCLLRSGHPSPIAVLISSGNGLQSQYQKCRGNL
jgi:hypothetical protein